MKTLTFKEIIILGLFNFALYAGAGNIILPPYVGLMAGDNVWISALGFFLTGVGLPVFAALAMARLKGSLTQLTMPIGKVAGLAVIIVCYLYSGPFVAIPRTATVAYDLGVRVFADSLFWERAYYIGFFVCVVLAALSPGRLFEIVGQILTPIKVGVLLILCSTIFFVPDMVAHTVHEGYTADPLSQGIIQGYLTMDTFGSLVFGMILVNAIRSRGVTDEQKTIRYVGISGILAGLTLMLVYSCLFRIGQLSVPIAGDATNGAQVLSRYIAHLFGLYGEVLICVVITVACMVTSIGLTASIGIFFNELTGIPYKVLVILSGLIALSVANLGLTQLLAYSVPALQAVYPVFIFLISLSFFQAYMKRPKLVALPGAICAFIFGLVDAMKSLNYESPLITMADHLPLGHLGLSWLLPCLVLVLFSFALDAKLGKLPEAKTA